MLRREAFAELLGTFLLVWIGVGAGAQAALGGEAFGSYLSINLAWGIGVVIGVCAAGSVSGAHINPAVTLALACQGDFPWRKVPAYILAQVTGAFAAALVVYCTYYEAIGALDLGIRAVTGPTATAGIFATYPAEHLSILGGAVDQFVGTALLFLGVMAVTDRRNAQWAKPIAPLLLGLLVAGIGMSFGFNAGYAINPARDFGPRLFTAVGGWGLDVFRTHSHWWWVPVVMPCVGAIAGGWLYRRLLPDPG